MINLLLEIAPIAPDGSIKSLHLCSRGAGSKSVQINGYNWLPLITKQFARTASWSDEGVLGETSISYEPITFEMSNEPGVANEIWSTYQWQGAYCRIWRGNDGDDFSSYIQVYEGSAGAIEREGLNASLPLLSTDFALDRNLLTRRYAGTDATGGSEGPSALRGTLKPYAAGVCANVQPILVDRVAMIYQYHGYGPTAGISAIFENALGFGPPAATATTWAALTALTLADGTWAAAPAIGAFRLANQPTGTITADVFGAQDGTTFPTTVGTIMPMLIKATGLLSDRIAPSLTGRNESWCLYADTQTTVGEELKLALKASGCAAIPTADGKYAAMDFYSLNPTPVKINSDQSANPIVRSYKQLAIAPPVWQVVVSGERSWHEQSESEVSQYVSIVSAELEAKDAEIKEAKAEAALAQAQADAQKRRVDDIQSDGILDRSEKADQNRRYTEESAIKVEMMNKSTSFDVTDQRASYLASYNNLSLYLNSLNPSFFDLTQNTPITSMYGDYWKSYELAKVTLANAMTGDASLKAVWGGVSGTGKPENYATVGAPAGTNVGGRPAETVISNIDAALAAVATLGGAGYLDNEAPPIPTGLTMSSTLTDIDAKLSVVWSASTASDFAYYVISIKEGSGNFVDATTASPYFEKSGVSRNQAFTARVKAVDRNTNPSGWSSEVTVTTAKDTVAPAVPTNLSVVNNYNSVTLNWTNPADSDLKIIEIWRSTTNNTTAATKIDSISVAPGQPGQKQVENLTKATNYYFFLKAVDTSNNASPFTAAIAALTTGGIVASDFTPNVYPTTTVTSLPAVAGYSGTPLVMFNNELYRIVNGAWSKSVNGTDIVSGTIPGIALVPTTALPSTITVANVSGLNTIADAFSRADWTKIIGVGKPADNATKGAPAGSLVGSTLAESVENYALDPAARVNANVTTIAGGKITTGTITANQIASQTIIADNISTGAITATKIAAAAITADKIAANTITAEQIAANTISAGKLLIADTTNFAENPDFSMGNVGWTLQSNGGTAPVITATSASEAYQGTWIGAVSASSTGGFRNKGLMRVTAGDQLLGFIIAKCGAAIIYPRISFVNNAGTEVVQIPGSSIVANGSYQRMSVTAVVPAGATMARVEAFYDVQAGGFAYLGFAGLMRRATGELIVDGVITANKVAANAITADKIAANSITANLLTLSTRPISTFGFDLRAGNDNVLRWDGGYIQFVNNAGTYVSEYVAPGTATMPNGAAAVYVYYSAGSGVLSATITDTVALGTPTNKFIANWYGGSKLTIAAGVGTLLNGDRIITGTIAANKIMAKSITSNEILAGTISAAEIAAGAITTTKLAVGSVDATIIQDGSVTTPKIVVGSLNGDRITAGTLDANTVKAGTVLSNLIQVANTGFGASFDLGAAVVAANNPAQRINAGTTTIGPGLITISGGTTLANWRNGSDTTKIEGGSIAANTITANKITIGNRGISISGIDFSYNRQDGNLYWSSGYIYYVDDSNTPRAQPIVAGGLVWQGGTNNYLYWNKGAGSLTAGVDNYGAIAAGGGANALVMCTWGNGTNFNANYGGTIVDGDRITTGSIQANRLNVGTLSAITANIGEVTAGIIRSTDGNTNLNLNNGRLSFTKGGYRKVDGAGLGPNSNMVLWYGPTTVGEGSETIQNSRFALGTDGKVYYGAVEIGAGGAASTQTVGVGATITKTLAPGQSVNIDAAVFVDNSTGRGTMNVQVTAGIAGGSQTIILQGTGSYVGPGEPSGDTVFGSYQNTTSVKQAFTFVATANSVYGGSYRQAQSYLTI